MLIRDSILAFYVRVPHTNHYNEYDYKAKIWRYTFDIML